MSKCFARLVSYRTHQVVGRNAACACLCHSDRGRPLITAHTCCNLAMYGEVATREIAVAPLHQSVAEPVSNLKQVKLCFPCLFREQTRQKTNLPVSLAMQISCLQFSTGLEVLWAGQSYICIACMYGTRSLLNAACVMQVLHQEACIPCIAKLPCSITHVCGHMRVGSMTCVAWETVYCPCLVTAGAVTQLGASQGLFAWTLR